MPRCHGQRPLPARSQPSLATSGDRNLAVDTYLSHRAWAHTTEACNARSDAPYQRLVGVGHAYHTDAVRIFFTTIKSAPSARQADQPQPQPRRCVAPARRSVERAGECRAVTASSDGESRRRWRGSLARACSAEAHRRGPLPAAPLPRTPPQRVPAVTHRELPRCASWPGRRLASAAPVARRKVIGIGPERRALSGLAPPASRAPGDRFKPLRRNDLRDPPLSAGDLCQPSGPDGEGQARGQARSARDEPLPDLSGKREGSDPAGKATEKSR